MVVEGVASLSSHARLLVDVSANLADRVCDCVAVLVLWHPSRVAGQRRRDIDEKLAGVIGRIPRLLAHRLLHPS